VSVTLVDGDCAIRFAAVGWNPDVAERWTL
jgi:hypothetical protein